MNLLVRVVRKGCKLQDDRNKFKNASASVGASHTVHVTCARTQKYVPARLIKGMLCVCVLVVADKYILALFFFNGQAFAENVMWAFYGVLHH